MTSYHIKELEYRCTPKKGPRAQVLEGLSTEKLKETQSTVAEVVPPQALKTMSWTSPRRVEAEKGRVHASVLASGAVLLLHS